MAFGSLDDTQAAREPMADINTTPLVDVMLVLLVIFIITAPLFTHAVKLDLPDQPAASVQDRERPVVISIDAEGAVYWDDARLDDGAFIARLDELARTRDAAPPALHLRADKATRYERVAMVMAQAQRAGLTRIAFITEPNAANTMANPGARTDRPAPAPTTVPSGAAGTTR